MLIKIKKMKQKERVIKCYDTAAKAYGKEFFDELSKKTLDRMLLRRFAEENHMKGTCIDLACGPGQTTQFLFQHGLETIIGIDLSSGLIEEAKGLDKNNISFEQGDILNLRFQENEVGSALCFYGIVHFTLEELEKALREIYRVLQPKGHFLFSFHIGNEIVERDEFLGEQLEITFYFFEVEKVLEILKRVGFKQLDIVERYPYEGAEFPSRRAYILVEK